MVSLHSAPYSSTGFDFTAGCMVIPESMEHEMKWNDMEWNGIIVAGPSTHMHE